MKRYGKEFRLDQELMDAITSYMDDEFRKQI